MRLAPRHTTKMNRVDHNYLQCMYVIISRETPVYAVLCSVCSLIQYMQSYTVYAVLEYSVCSIRIQYMQSYAVYAVLCSVFSRIQCMQSYTVYIYGSDRPNYKQEVKHKKKLVLASAKLHRKS